jgi:tRNA-5-taurinomethyluridine 2-sulfurtransferase
MITNQHIGSHQGLWAFTIGQGARISGMSEKMFVARKDARTNTVYVVPGTYAPLPLLHVDLRDGNCIKQ